MSLFAHIKSFFVSERKILPVSAVFALFGIMFFGGLQTTFAADATSIQEAFVDLIVLVVHFVVYLSWIIIGMMGDLLSNDAVMHPGVISTLKLLWTIIRNFINMAAVFWLLYIAFKTLFNFGDDGAEEAKKGLPKLAAALVLVNFSWLFMVVIIDASTVATNYAFSLTDTVRGGIHFQAECKDGQTSGCAQQVYSIQYNKPPKAPNKTTGQETQPTETKKTDLRSFIFKLPYEDKASILEEPNFGDSKTQTRVMEVNDFNRESSSWECFADKAQTKTKTKGCTEEEFLKYKYETAVIILTLYPLNGVEGVGSHSITPMIATNLLQLESNLQRSKYTNSVGTLALDVIFSVVMSLIMLIAFVALFVILVIRVAVLWIALMASPLLVLYFFEPLESVVQENFEKVVHLAFVPAYFGVIFSLVFILIGQLGYQQNTFLGTVGLGDGTKPLILENGIMQAGSPLFSLLLTILVIVLFWMAVFWALEKADITGTVIETMKNGVQTGAKWVAKRPLYMDIIPMAKRADGSTVKGDLKSVLDNFERKMDPDRTWTNDYASNVHETKLDSKAEKAFNKVNSSDLKRFLSKEGVSGNIDPTKEAHAAALHKYMQGNAGLSHLSGSQAYNAIDQLAAKANGRTTEDRGREEYAAHLDRISRAVAKSGVETPKTSEKVPTVSLGDIDTTIKFTFEGNTNNSLSKPSDIVNKLRKEKDLKVLSTDWSDAMNYAINENLIKRDLSSKKTFENFVQYLSQASATDPKYKEVKKRLAK